MKLLATSFLVALAIAAPACLNDRDSMALESMRFPGLAEVIVGRFERNPAKYYEMRIKRIEDHGGPQTLDEYDDLAVAYGRIGNDAQAIKVMAKKGDLLGKGQGNPMDQYRYEANLGTFLVHKWFHEGADPKKISEVEVARDHIARSIGLNPEAHFGREKVQLGIMEWIIDVKKGTTKETYGERVTSDPKVDLRKEIEGLEGLVVLGAAWESVDVYEAIQAITKLRGDSGMWGFATRRLAELKKLGRKSLLGDRPLKPDGLDAHRLGLYKDWRANAEQYQKNRTSFMEAQFAKGKHPDTNPDFWNGYDEVPKMEWPRKPFYTWPEFPFYVAVGLILLCPIAFYVRSQRMRRLAKG